MKLLSSKDHSALRESIVELHLTAHELPYRPCGLNASWSVSAWHLGPGTRPNHDREPQLYLLDNESDIPGKEHDLVWCRFDPEKDDEAEISTVVDCTTILSCLEEAVRTLVIMPQSKEET